MKNKQILGYNTLNFLIIQHPVGSPKFNTLLVER